MKIKPCPFRCGCKAGIWAVVDLANPLKKTYQIHHYCELFSQHLTTLRFDTKAEAIKAWNRRPK